MTSEVIEEIKLKLKAPINALEMFVEKGRLPRVFAEAALEELRKTEKLVGELERKKKRNHV